MTCPGLDWINSVIGEQIPWTCFTPLLLLLCCFPSISVDKTIQSLSNNCAYHLCCFFLLSSNTSMLLNRMKLHLSPFVWALFEYLIPFLIRYSRSQACCRLLVSCLSTLSPFTAPVLREQGAIRTFLQQLFHPLKAQTVHYWLLVWETQFCPLTYHSCVSERSWNRCFSEDSKCIKKTLCCYAPVSRCGK